MLINEKQLDPRSLCALKDCSTRARHLIAWPMRFPIPLCTAHWDEIQYSIPGSDKFTPRQWLEWIKLRGKDTLFAPKKD